MEFSYTRSGRLLGRINSTRYESNTYRAFRRSIGQRILNNNIRTGSIVAVPFFPSFSVLSPVSADRRGEKYSGFSAVGDIDNPMSDRTGDLMYVGIFRERNAQRREHPLSAYVVSRISGCGHR